MRVKLVKHSVGTSHKRAARESVNHATSRGYVFRSRAIARSFKEKVVKKLKQNNWRSLFILPELFSFSRSPFVFLFSCFFFSH